MRQTSHVTVIWMTNENVTSLGCSTEYNHMDKFELFKFKTTAIKKQEAQLPQRNSASAAHMEGG